MKYVLVIFLLSFYTVKSNAQSKLVCGFSKKKGYTMKDISSFTVKQLPTVESNKGVPNVVSKIEIKIGYNLPISVYYAADDEDSQFEKGNCYASEVNGGEKCLIVDVDFLHQVNSESDTKWAAISVIAHEVGHHLGGLQRHSDQKDNELDADYWSGYILKKLGASRNNSIKCMEQYGTDEDTWSHPKRDTRIAMIKKGWDDADNGTVDITKCDNCGISNG